VSGLRKRRCSGIAILCLFALAAPAWPQATPLVDPRGTLPGASELPIDEASWARVLVGELQLSDALEASSTDAERFGLLCPESAEVVTEAGGHQAVGSAFDVSAELPTHGPGGRVRSVVSVPATALYQLEVEGVGLQRWVIDGRPVGHIDLSELGVALAPVILPLRAGPHELTGTMLPGASAARVRLAAWRVLCIAPADGWRSARPLTWGAWARTLVRTFGLEFELPEEAEYAQQIEAEAFTSASAGGGRTRRRLRDGASGGAWVMAATSPAEFTWRLYLERPQVLTLSARTHGSSPQIWSVDGRHQVQVLPEGRPGGFHWDRVTTLTLPAGEHAVRVRVARGSGVDALRVVARRSSDRDFVRILGGLGLPIGPPDSAMPGSVAEASLTRPLSLELTRSLRERLAGAPGEDASIALVEIDPQVPPLRPLSPALPSEL
jgi:hypothetical protein